MSNLVQWLRANKISLNVDKTELIIFKSKQTLLTKKCNRDLPKHLNFRISGQRINPTNKIKYLGILIDENISFKHHLQEVAIKLSRANGMLAKIRHFVTLESLLNIYHAIFGSHLRYACQVWGQSKSVQVNRIASLQRKALRIVHFQPYQCDCEILFYMSNILPIYQLVQFLNCLFVWEHQHSILPRIFDDYFTKRTGYNHTLRSTTNNNLFVPLKQTFTYGINSIAYQCILCWNILPSKLKTDPNIIRSKTTFSKAIFNYFHEQFK